MEFAKPDGSMRFLPMPFEDCMQIFDANLESELECEGPFCLVCRTDGFLFAVALKHHRPLLEQLVILGQLMRRAPGVLDAAIDYLGRKD